MGSCVGFCPGRRKRRARPRAKSRARSVTTLAPVWGMNPTQTPSLAHRFRAYAEALEVVSATTPLIDRLRPHRKHLADQLERASDSAALNLAEGNERKGADRIHLFRVAAGSMREVLACLDLAERRGVFAAAELTSARRHADAMLAMTWSLCH